MSIFKNWDKIVATPDCLHCGGSGEAPGDGRTECGFCHGLTPAKRAASRGHTVVWDPSFTGKERWTCTACFCAVLRHNGNVYGSAVETDCIPVNQQGEEA